MRRQWQHAAFSFLALCGAISNGAETALDDAPLIPPKATVVLLSSLAGDLESERAYTEQTRAWIEIISQTTAERLVLFSETTEQPQLPRIKVERFKPSRAEFLNATTNIAGGTNPLVVIAWGHGGTQGQSPVFHVRGPRLNPADFKQFADKTSGPSTWILMFRGSGRFANELKSFQRRILSSENDAIFRNDPIGMAVLLRAMRANPTNSFTALAGAFGPAVARWYDEQNLARTEEPTVWIGTSRPRPLLAAPQIAESTPPLEAQKPAAASPKPPPPPKPDTNAVAWHDVARVKDSDYPNADAIVLKRRITYTLASKPAISAEHEEYIQVLTPEGKQAGDFDISYSPPDERLEFLDCEIQRPDGSVLRVDPDEIRDAADESESPLAPQSRRKFFSVPDITPGAIIHVRYTREWQRFPLPHVTLKLPVADELPARDTLLRVNVPKNAPFHFRFDHVAASEPEVTKSDYSTTYTWNFKDTLPWEPEPLSLPDNRPALSISTFPTWKEFIGWYDRIIRLADQSTSEITNKAVELTRDSKSDRDKIAALYNYITGLRYVAVPLGVNSFRPHAAAGVLRNQYGDCKDKANLLNALLRSQGIDAHLVLVPRFSQAHENLPGFAFNHAISRVRFNNETLWLDTTDDVCRFGMLPPGDSGRRVLVVDGDSQALTTLPQARSKDHTLQLATRVDMSALGNDLPVTLQAEATGYADYSFRSSARMIGKVSSVPLLNAGFQLLNASFASKKQEFTSPSDLERDFALTASGTLIGLFQRDGTNSLVRPPLWLPNEWMLALHERRSPLFLNDGYPLLLKQRAEIKLPEGATHIRLPRESKSDSGPLRWSLMWSQNSNRELVAQLQCELPEAELSKDQTAQFQTQLRELFAAVSQTATISLTNSNHR